MKYYASLCAIAKDELTIRNWLFYHFSIGFEHAVIYDNESEVPLTDVLSDFIEAGLVDVELFRKESRPQLQVYTKFLKEHGHTAKWVAFIDIDEYIVPKSCSDIREYLSDYEEYAGLVMSWVVFGSNGHETRPAQPVPVAYPNCLHQSTAIKSIVQPEYTVPRVLNPHFFYFQPGKYCVNEDRFPVYGSLMYHTSCTIQLNHYRFMSREDYAVKMKRGCADQVKKDPKRKVNEMEPFEEQWGKKGTPDSAIEPHIKRFLTFRKFEAKKLAVIVLEACSYPLQQYLENLNSLLLSQRIQPALVLFKKALRYYPMNPELYPIGLMVYLASNQPEKAKSFMRNAMVRSMEHSKNISDSYVHMGVLFEVLKQYFTLIHQTDKANDLHKWWRGDERRFKQGEGSFISQFEWLKK